jgi:cytochrome b
LNFSGTSKIMEAHKVKIWDRFVRFFHWSMVAGIAVTWFTADEIKWLHEWVGYGVAALTAGRIVWGFTGTRYSRFRQFVPTSKQFFRYLWSIVKGNERRFLGHNPAGAAMIIALLLTVAGTAFTGWLQTTDQYFGSDLVYEAHEMLANGILVLAFLHVVGVAVASVRHKENLVKSMLTGVKRAAESGDVS